MVHRLKSENLRISGEIGKACITKQCKGLPMKFSDWDIYPLVITLFNKEFKQEKKNE